MDTKSNLAIWNSLCETPPKHTKQFDRGGFRGTAINATYVAMRLTEMFGPCGLGWRFVLEDERIIEGPAVTEHVVRKTTVLNSKGEPTETIDTETTSDKRELLHVVRGHIEYRMENPSVKGEWLPDWRATGPQFGQTKLVQMVGRGTEKERLVFDEEAPKKSITDCTAKCAVMLGVGADVHMGLYDDNKYVNDLTAKFAPKLDKDKYDALIAAMTAAGLRMSTFLKTYSIKDLNDLPPSLFGDALTKIADYGKARAAKEKAAKPADDGLDPNGQDAK